ncbi:putative MFS sugar transporter [Halenospora varia]|nr:putative MFS sugar transporter [Halenospora varia]
MLDLKEVEVRHMEATTNSRIGDLAAQGEALEAAEKERGYGGLLAAYSCAAIYGYDSIANNATLAMPAFQLYFGHVNPATGSLYLDSIWTSLWSSMSGVGQILGSVIAGPLSQLIGRRHAAMACGAVSLVGVALQYIAMSKGLLLAGKVINGGAVGGLLSVGSTYASEISPPRLRGVFLSGLAFFGVAMQCVGLGVIRSFVPDLTPRAFRISFALQWLVGGLPIIAFFCVPESPNYLLMKGQVEAARKSIARIYGENNSVDARLARLQSGIQHELTKDNHASYLDCFKGTDRKRTLTVALLMIGINLVGSAFLTQNIYFLGLAGLPAIHSFDINIGGFGLALVVIPCSWYFGDKIGRRLLYLIGVVGNTIGMAVVGGLGYAPSTNKAATWTVAVLLNALITWQLVTCFMVSWSMAPELSSYKLRQQTQSIAISVQALSTWFFAFVTPYMYNVGAGSGNLGAKTGFIFMGLSMVLFVMAYLWVPETQNLTTEEIDYLYESKTSPRRFKSSVEVMNRIVTCETRDEKEIELREINVSKGVDD